MREYLVIIEKTVTGYSAYPPDLPGVGTVGATLEEVKQNIKEAIELHLEGLREEGEELPEGTTTVDVVTVN